MELQFGETPPRQARTGGCAGGGRLARYGAQATLALFGALALVWCSSLVTPGASQGGRAGLAIPQARACGLQSPQTMQANGVSALVYPQSVSAPNHPLSLFALDYAAGAPVSFNEDLSRAPGQDPRKYRWRWDFGDGSGYTYEVAPKHTYKKAGSYRVQAEIFDSSTNSWGDDDPFDTAEIHIIPAALANPPIAKASASDTIFGLGQTISFDATGSRAQVGSNLTYTWNFNDGVIATGPRATHQFVPLNVTGASTVALIVSDDRGAKSLTTITVTVLTAVPTAKLTASVQSVALGDAVTFDASGSTAPDIPGGDKLTRFDWTFGDGTTQETTDSSVSHTYQKAGSYTTTVRAYDQQGAAGVAQTQVTVIAVSGGGGGDGHGWLLIGGAVAVLLVALAGGFYALREQRQRVALIRRRQMAQELARARTVKPVKPVKGRGGPPPSGSPARGRPPQGARPPRER